MRCICGIWLKVYHEIYQEVYKKISRCICGKASGRVSVWKSPLFTPCSPQPTSTPRRQFVNRNGPPYKTERIISPQIMLDLQNSVTCNFLRVCVFLINLRGGRKANLLMVCFSANMKTFWSHTAPLCKYIAALASMLALHRNAIIWKVSLSLNWLSSTLELNNMSSIVEHWKR